MDEAPSGLRPREPHLLPPSESRHQRLQCFRRSTFVPRRAKRRLLVDRRINRTLSMAPKLQIPTMKELRPQGPFMLHNSGFKEPPLAPDSLSSLPSPRLIHIILTEPGYIGYAASNYDQNLQTINRKRRDFDKGRINRNIWMYDSWLDDHQNEPPAQPGQADLHDPKIPSGDAGDDHDHDSDNHNEGGEDSKKNASDEANDGDDDEVHHENEGGGEHSDNYEKSEGGADKNCEHEVESNASSYEDNEKGNENDRNEHEISPKSPAPSNTLSESDSSQEVAETERNDKEIPLPE